MLNTYEKMVPKCTIVEEIIGICWKNKKKKTKKTGKIQKEIEKTKAT